MPNVIREDVVQVSFRSDGISDMLRGEDALSQIQTSARSAGRALSQTEGDVEAAGTAFSQLKGDVKATDTALSQMKENADKTGDAFQSMGEDAEQSAERVLTRVERLQQQYEAAGMTASEAFQAAQKEAERLEEFLKETFHNTDKTRQDYIQKMLDKDLFRNLDDDELRNIGESAEESKSAVDDLTESANVLTDVLSGVAAAFSVGVLLQNVAETQQALNKLQAQTGATALEMESMGEAVKTIYTSGIGESLGEVADTAALVNQQFKDLDTDTMQNITQSAMTMADTFGTDVNETLRGVNALMVNMGLTAEEAFDYIAKGTQNGLDKSGELSDNIAEYSQLWAQAGFSAEEMFTVLQNGLDSGAYNLDKVNDFVKEFTISLSDGRIEENIDSFSDRTQTLFAQWQNGTASQKDVFQSVIHDLSTMTSQQEALTLASTVWSALGEDNAMQVITSLNNVNDTYSEVKGTMESINEIRYADIGTSFEQLKRSASGLLTETLTPAVTGLNGLLSAGLDSLTAFASEHEALAQGMAVAATASGVLTVGLIAVSGAIGVVKTAFDALNVSTGGVLKIIGLVVAGGSALVGIFAGLHAAMAEEETEVEDYAGTLSECRTEIEQTELALSKAKERYGENSATVKSLESDLELLHAQYEKGGGELGEMQQRVDETAESFRQMAQAQQETMDSIDQTEISGLQAVSMLEALSQKSELTSADLDAMGKYADYLNDTFECNIVVDYDTGELTGFDPENIASQIRSMQDAARSEEAMSYITGSDFTSAYLDAASEYFASEQRLRNLQVEYDQLLKTGREDFNGDMYYADDHRVAELASEIEGWTATVDENKAVLEEQSAALEENGKIAGLNAETIQELEDSLIGVAKGADKAASSTEDFHDATSEAAGEAAANSVIQQYSGQLEELCQAYDEAYAKAEESFSSQFGLFDQAEANMDYSISAAQKALDSQLTYWTNYADNVQTISEGFSLKIATDLGVTEESYNAMMAYAQSGTEEAAGFAASMAAAIDSGNTEALVQLADTVGAVDAAQQEAVSLTAAWQTNLDQAMSETISSMQSSVAELNLSGDAANAANATMNAYISNIQSSVGSAQAAAQSVVSAVQAVFNSASLSFGAGGVSGSVTVPGHASGTTNAEDVFVAGERGAELVIGKQGSTVFPASETAKIINAVKEYSDLSGGYQPEQSASYRYDSQTTTMLAPTFQLYLSGGMNSGNQRQAKQWMQQIVDEMFAGVLRTNPPAYTI